MTKYQGMHYTVYPGIKGENVLPLPRTNTTKYIYIECT